MSTSISTIARLEQGEHAFIVCLGDSITEQNYHTHGRLNYVGQLAERLMERFGRNTLVLNAGISGNTTRHLLERLDRDVLGFRPSLVTVMVGMNDATWGDDGLPEFERNLREVIDRLRSGGSEVLLLTQNPIDPQINDIASRLGSYPKYVDVIRRISAESGVSLCDLHAAWLEHAQSIRGGHWSLMNDPVHPNEHGHDFFARTLFSYLGI